MLALLRPVLVLLATGGLLAVFLRQAEFSQVWAGIRLASGPMLMLSLVFTTLTYVLRAVRWQVLLSPIGRVAFGPAFRTTVMGFSANFLLPARAGEVLRPYLLARQQRLDVTATFATIVVERLLDLMTVLALFFLFTLSYVPDPRVDLKVFRAVELGVGLATLGAAAALAMGLFVSGRPAVAQSMVERLGSVLPARAAAFVGDLLARFITGFAVLQDRRAFTLSLLLSLPLWLAIAGGIWSVTAAFHLPVPLLGSLLVMAILVVGVSVPTPGAVGGFHEAYRFATTAFYAVPNNVAVGAALVLHAVSFVPVTVLGLVFMAREGFTLTRLREVADEGRHQHDASPAPASEPGFRAP
ncbi:MAG: lysylphosphatidylglycerol synthase transmembrane domain-containing protein [Vicinamibacterales bacterium]